jgi:hypothetical protein
MLRCSLLGAALLAALSLFTPARPPLHTPPAAYAA